jgi:protease-4
MLQEALGSDEETADADTRDMWTIAAGLPEQRIVSALADARRILGGPAIQVRCLECVAQRPPRPGDNGAARSLVGWLASRAAF